MRTISCRHCGKTYSEAQREWDYAWQTGTCPGCGRFFDPARESQAGVDSLNPDVIVRARKRRAKMIQTGLLFLASAAILASLRVPGALVIVLVIAGVPPLIRGLFHTPKAQAQAELAKPIDLDRKL